SGANIQARLPAHDDIKMIESGHQLQSAAADVFPRRLHGERYMFLKKLRWLRRNSSADQYFAGHYCASRLLAAGEQHLPHKKVIKPYLLRHLSSWRYRCTA